MSLAPAPVSDTMGRASPRTSSSARATPVGLGYPHPQHAGHRSSRGRAHRVALGAARRAPRATARPSGRHRRPRPHLGQQMRPAAQVEPEVDQPRGQESRATRATVLAQRVALGAALDGAHGVVDPPPAYRTRWAARASAAGDSAQMTGPLPEGYVQHPRGSGGRSRRRPGQAYSAGSVLLRPA